MEEYEKQYWFIIGTVLVLCAVLLGVFTTVVSNKYTEANNQMKSIIDEDRQFQSLIGEYLGRITFNNEKDSLDKQCERPFINNETYQSFYEVGNVFYCYNVTKFLKSKSTNNSTQPGNYLIFSMEYVNTTYYYGNLHIATKVYYPGFLNRNTTEMRDCQSVFSEGKLRLLCLES